MKFTEAFTKYQDNPAVWDLHQARLACFKAGLTRECDSITRRLRSLLAKLLGNRITTG